MKAGIEAAAVGVAAYGIHHAGNMANGSVISALTWQQY